MKRAVLCIVIFTLLFPIFTINSGGMVSANNLETADLMRELTSEQEAERVQLQELHKKIVELKQASLNEQGQIEVHASHDELSIDKVLYDKYLQRIERSNYLVSVGGVYYNENLELVFMTQEEAVNDIFKKDQEKMKRDNFYVRSDEWRSGGVGSSFDISPFTSKFAPLNTPPVLSAYHVALANKKELQDFYIVTLYIEGSGVIATAQTTALWIARVMPNGSWDYKVQPGYTPYNKTWLAITRFGQAYRTSEWFGNYNYGFTGRFLFSLNVLYAGGDGAGLIWGNGFDNKEDKDAIKMGYDESY